MFPWTFFSPLSPGDDLLETWRLLGADSGGASTWPQRLRRMWNRNVQDFGGYALLFDLFFMLSPVLALYNASRRRTQFLLLLALYVNRIVFIRADFEVNSQYTFSFNDAEKINLSHCTTTFNTPMTLSNNDFHFYWRKLLKRKTSNSWSIDVDVDTNADSWWLLLKAFTLFSGRKLLRKGLL